MLPDLTGLYLHYSELGQLPELAELYLGVNNLSGSIPVELGHLGSLKHYSSATTSSQGAFRQKHQDENNSELCGTKFDSLKACPDESNEDDKMPSKPESTSIKPQQIPETTNLNRNCDSRGCAKPSTLSTGAVLAGTIIIVAGAAACGLSVLS